MLSFVLPAAAVICATPPVTCPVSTFFHRRKQATTWDLEEAWPGAVPPAKARFAPRGGGSSAAVLLKGGGAVVWGAVGKAEAGQA